jgi:tetratricopeptide (TPR) repeat protein
MRFTGRFLSWAFAGAIFCRSTFAVAADDTVQQYPACDHTPTPGDVAGAKGAFDAGQASFNEADYDRAINYWEDAYRRDCTAHVLLLNLARAYELNEQKHRAVNALQTYLARNPNSSDKSQIDRRIDKLQEQIKAETPVAPVAAAGTGPAPVAPGTVPVASATTPTTPPPSSEIAPSSGGSRSLVPLFVAGGGGAIAIVGAVLHFSAASDLNHYEQICPNRKCSSANADVESQANSARTRADIGGGVAFAGLGILAGGVIWYFLEKPSSPSASATPRSFTARVAPAVVPGYGGLSVAGEF